MTSTNLSLNGEDLEKKLHEHFGSIAAYNNELKAQKETMEMVANREREYPNEGDSDIDVFEILPNSTIDTKFNLKDKMNIAYPFDLKNNCYSYKPAGEGNPKKYWVLKNEDKIILITMQKPHGELAKEEEAAKEGKQSFGAYFKAEEIVEITNYLKETYQLPTEVIIPRIETGMREDHIVIEYHPSQGPSLIIDSKRGPSGFNHSDIKKRINTGRQAFSNAEDCGYHVIQTIPILANLISSNTIVNEENLNRNLTAAGTRSIAINKLEKLQDIYRKRVFEGNEKYPLNCLLSCFSFFGYFPSVKEAAVKQILKNIKTGDDIFHSLSDEEQGAAKQGVLGKTVEEYLDSIVPPEQPLSPDII